MMGFRFRSGPPPRIKSICPQPPENWYVPIESAHTWPVISTSYHVDSYHLGVSPDHRGIVYIIDVHKQCRVVVYIIVEFLST